MYSGSFSLASSCVDCLSPGENSTPSLLIYSLWLFDGILVSIGIVTDFNPFGVCVLSTILTSMINSD